MRKTFQVEQPAGPKALGQEGFWLTGRTEGRSVSTGVQTGAKNWIKMERNKQVRKYTTRAVHCSKVQGKLLKDF